MSTAPFSSTCVAKGSRCVAPGHDGQIGPDGMCRVARAWHKNARVCGLCKTASVHEQTASRLNPIFVVGLIRGLVMPPIVRGVHPELGQAYQAAIEMCYGYFCEGCIAKIAPFLNAPEHAGQVQFKAKPDGSPGSWYPMFVTPTELTAVWSAIGVGVVKLAERIARGGRDILFGETRHHGEEAQCVVHKNTPSACLCGGWYEAKEMPALKRGEKQLFALGPLCAEAARRGGFKLEESFAESLAEMHRETPAQIDARLAAQAERERLEAEGTYIDQRGRRHVGNEAIAKALEAARERDLAKARELRAEGRHVPARLFQLLKEAEGEAEPVPVTEPRPRRPRQAQPPEAISAEEQLRRLQAKAADRLTRQQRQQARRHEPGYGEMKVAAKPAGKNKKKAAEAGSESTGKGKRRPGSQRAA